MTKKDYIAIASALARLRKFSAVYAGANMQPFTPGNAIIEIANVETELANVFAQDNGRFDRSRFLAACQTGPTNK